MDIEGQIEKLHQNSTTTGSSAYRLTIKAIGTKKDCDELMEWIVKYGKRKQMVNYKEWKI